MAVWVSSTVIMKPVRTAVAVGWLFCFILLWLWFV
jgi:hypothetical protein